MRMGVRAGMMAAVLAISASAVAAPAALATDPPKVAPPAAMAAMQIASGDGAMNAIVYSPGGAGPHPAMLLFHGFPGNEQNLDLAQAARRAGFVVLTLHYRGSWGSPGTFTLAHNSEDGLAAFDWLSAPAQLTRFGIDPRRVVIAGHSMGGQVAIRTAAARPQAAGLLVIDSGNPGAGYKAMRARGEALPPPTPEMLADFLPLVGTSPQARTAELAADPDRYDNNLYAAKLAPRPVLLVAASLHSNLPAMRALRDNIAGAGGKAVTHVELPTDHGFNDHRIALISASLDWLQQFAGKP
jgi:pimeloyl-ACP methyl ester carboxylesterase